MARLIFFLFVIAFGFTVIAIGPWQDDRPNAGSLDIDYTRPTTSADILDARTEAHEATQARIRELTEAQERARRR